MTNGENIKNYRNVPIQMPHHGRLPHGIRFRVPWRIHELAWKQYSKNYSGQDAETIAARGGFGLEELIYLLAGENPYAMKNDDPMATDFWGKFNEE